VLAAKLPRPKVVATLLETALLLLLAAGNRQRTTVTTRDGVGR